ncbi:unnamed protein product, partial [Pleuronectes platessa]
RRALTWKTRAAIGHTPLSFSASESQSQPGQNLQRTNQTRFCGDAASGAREPTEHLHHPPPPPLPPLLHTIPQIQALKMGRRKSKRKPPPKKKMTGNLDTQFTCPFCNHEKSCDVKMERTRNTGDHIVQRLPGGVPDAHHLSVRARGRLQRLDRRV